MDLLVFGGKKRDILFATWEGVLDCIVALQTCTIAAGTLHLKGGVSSLLFFFLQQTTKHFFCML